MQVTQTQSTCYAKFFIHLSQLLDVSKRRKELRLNRLHNHSLLVKAGLMIIRSRDDKEFSSALHVLLIALRTFKHATAVELRERVFSLRALTAEVRAIRDGIGEAMHEDHENADVLRALYVAACNAERFLGRRLQWVEQIEFNREA